MEMILTIFYEYETNSKKINVLNKMKIKLSGNRKENYLLSFRESNKKKRNSYDIIDYIFKYLNK